jgi:hypothetical protein
MHMPAHAFNGNLSPVLNSYLQQSGTAIDCTTDDHFGNLGSYLPPTKLIAQS